MWEALTDEEQDQTLKKVGALLKEHGLAHIKPKALDQVIYMINKKTLQRQRALIIEGSVSADQSDAAEKFKKAAKAGPLSDINPRTANIDIEVKLQSGGPFIPITEVNDIFKQEEQSINHKAG